jgi:dTDP-4-amino-4,6-dideoxygalactose transaminase
MRLPQYVSAWPELRLRDLIGDGTLHARPYPLSAAHPHYSYVARNVIYHLFRELVSRGENVVLVPSYHHGNEVRAIRASGARMRFYPVGRDLQPDWSALEALCTPDVRVLYLIHYIGFPQPIERLRIWKKRGLTIVEDCALAFLSQQNGRSVGRFGDYSVFCLYKTLPLPNGGVLVGNDRPLEKLECLRQRPSNAISVVGRTLDLLLESFRSHRPLLGAAAFAAKRSIGRLMDALRWRRIPIGDSAFDPTSTDIEMSGICYRLLRRFDYAQIRERRRWNFEYLAERLTGKANLLRTQLADGTCPLFFPILVKNKGAAARHLGKRGIGAVELWNEGDPESAGGRFPETDFLRRHVLELPLHQSLSPAQLEYMADEVAAWPGHL